MKRETSAGGVVFYKDSILMLMKQNGDWVLPKGHIEDGELAEAAALREVFEEGGVRAVVKEYIGDIDYRFSSRRDAGITKCKNVSWYYMLAESDETKPQLEEGFIRADFIDMNTAPGIVKYNEEQKMIVKAVEIHNRNRNR